MIDTTQGVYNKTKIAEMRDQRSLSGSVDYKSESSSDEPNYGVEYPESDTEISHKPMEVDLRNQIAAQAGQVPQTLRGLLLDPATLLAKTRNWQNITKKRFSQQKKFGKADQQKEILPPEVLRYLNPT